MDKNAAVTGSAIANCSKMRTPSSRRNTAADVVAAIDRGHAEFGRFPQHVHRKVFGGIPFQGVRSQAFAGEGGRRLDDHPFVVVKDKHDTLTHCGDDEFGTVLDA